MAALVAAIHATKAFKFEKMSRTCRLRAMRFAMSGVDALHKAGHDG
jgi:hypothetical protein